MKTEQVPERGESERDRENQRMRDSQRERERLAQLDSTLPLD